MTATDWPVQRRATYLRDLGHSWALRISLNSEWDSLVHNSALLKQRYILATAGIAKQDSFESSAKELKRSAVIWSDWAIARTKLTAQLFMLLKEPSGKSVSVNIKHPDERAIMHYIVEFNGLVARPKGELTVKHVSDDGHEQGFQRSYFTNENNTVHLRDNPNRGVVWHEIGHWIENTVPGIRSAVQAYLKRRTEDRLPISLNILQGPGHHPDEKAKLGNFLEPYIGKVYEDGDSEILSMGLQYLAEDPGTLWLCDRDMFYFVLGIIRSVRGRGVPWHSAPE